MSIISPLINKLLDFFKLDSTREMENGLQEPAAEPQEPAKRVKENIIISDYSTMPRFYTINGIKYDIDDPREIRDLPIIRSTFLIRGERYGLDSVLRKHSAEAYTRNKDIYNASLEKLDEYHEKGICYKTQSEIQHELERAEIEKEITRKEDEKLKLHNSFTIEDMERFINIPFEWHWVMELSHSNGIAWFMLNKNNQYIALSILNSINHVLDESKLYTGCDKNFYICTENIDFFFPVPMHENSIPNTYVQCIPYTPKGKLSKYPAILHFSEYPTKRIESGFEITCYNITGDIYFLQTGDIGKADINIDGYKIKIRLHGLDLIVKRIDKLSLRGNTVIYKFDLNDLNC